MHRCEKEGCTRYSDIDVYYEDGSSKDMCSAHACEEKNVIQCVPQHGGPMNQEIQRANAT